MNSNKIRNLHGMSKLYSVMSLDVSENKLRTLGKDSLKREHSFIHIKLVLSATKSDLTRLFLLPERPRGGINLSRELVGFPVYTSDNPLVIFRVMGLSEISSKNLFSSIFQIFVLMASFLRYKGKELNREGPIKLKECLLSLV